MLEHKSALWQPLPSDAEWTAAVAAGAGAARAPASAPLLDAAPTDLLDINGPRQPKHSWQVREMPSWPRSWTSHSL